MTKSVWYQVLVVSTLDCCVLYRCIRCQTQCDVFVIIVVDGLTVACCTGEESDELSVPEPAGGV